MKKEKWYRSMSLADDKYIAEAHPDNMIKPKRNRVLISVAASCACLALLVFNLWLFIPFNTKLPDVSQYADSEYYGVIQRLNELTAKKPYYNNNAEKIWTSLIDFSYDSTEFIFSQYRVENDTLAGGLVDGTSKYEEITDNQVEGIIEADFIKRSDTHIYYLDMGTLRIYSIDKENTAEVGSYSLLIKNYYLEKYEMYLSEDCKTVTLIAQYCENFNDDYDSYCNNKRCVNLISIDVSDPASIVKKEEFSITGAYESSRIVDGNILLFTNFLINKQDFDFNDETTYIPQIDEGNGAYCIPASCIVSPDVLGQAGYTIVTKLDRDTLKLKGTVAYLSHWNDVYVSENHVFLARYVSEKEVNNKTGMVTSKGMTEISCLSYSGDGFESKGAVKIGGYIKDQWSMDEYEGILRVFATTSGNKSRYKLENNRISYYEQLDGQRSASLYCIDLSTFKIVASVIDFAPPTEIVQSVRFDKKTAYVCTSVQLLDPVFFFDLSDIDNITYKDTGTIKGFSTSLINFGNGYLIGIGRGTYWTNFKIEVYEEAEDGVRSVCSYELKIARYSTEYKSYYVDRENQLVGIGVIDFNYYKKNNNSDEAYRYILLHFNGHELIELVNVPLYGSPVNMRGVYIDGYMYMFGCNYFKVEKVFD